MTDNRNFREAEPRIALKAEADRSPTLERCAGLPIRGAADGTGRDAKGGSGRERLRPPPAYQSRVSVWMRECFPPEVATDVTERSHRFLEEALETVQACGCTASEAHQLVDYVFGRPTGELRQEVGGVLVCLAALCDAHQFDMDAAGEAELARVWTMVDRIRAKHAAKPRFSPLPGCSPL